MVTFLQRTFTSLVHAHAGRTQVAQERAINGAGQPQSAHASHFMRRLCLPLSSALYGTEIVLVFDHKRTQG
jgi:hypothetical protein